MFCLFSFIPTLKGGAIGNAIILIDVVYKNWRTDDNVRGELHGLGTHVVSCPTLEGGDNNPPTRYRALAHFRANRSWVKQMANFL